VLLRAAFLLALAATASCRLASARSLREPGARGELSNRLYATLDEQEHYFAGAEQAEEFRRRLQAIAHSTSDAPSYYRGVSDALAVLDEGHTGLVASRTVPFASTIPPVSILQVEGQMVVAGVAPGVEGGGLRPGDVILEVDSETSDRVLARRLKVTGGSTEHGRRARAVANLLAGPTNSPARVRVRGMDGRVRHCFPLRFLLDDEGEDRFRFGFAPRSAHGVRISAEAGYVALPDFHPGRRIELEESVAALRRLPVLILDLRGNPGGRIRTLQKVAGMFLDERADLLQVRSGERVQVVRSEPQKIRYRGRLAILVDERTGSAAELLAAALQDLGRASVYGRRTAGSARSRKSTLLPGRVVFHYAGRIEFLRLDGGKVEGVGIEPDLFVTPSRASLARGAYGDPERDLLVRLAAGLN
jgi:C-terminal processing protease CtpA/Prc